MYEVCWCCLNVRTLKYSFVIHSDERSAKLKKKKSATTENNNKISTSYLPDRCRKNRKINKKRNKKRNKEQNGNGNRHETKRCPTSVI